MARTLWPHQESALAECLQTVDQRPQSVVVSSATGTGKSEIIFRILQYIDRNHLKAIVYCNRRLLFDQLARGLYECGVTYGSRAAGHRTNLRRDIQLAMLQTEQSQVLRNTVRQLHQADVVIIDEAHLMKKGAALTLIKKHKAAGATIIGFSATPADVGHIYDRMILGADTPQGRRCGALLEAQCFAPDMPCRNFIKRVKASAIEELDETAQQKWLNCIIGRIYEHWISLNPDRLPTVCFGPGKAESLWIAQQLASRGVKAAHIDAEGVWVDGQWISGDSARAEVLERIESNDLEVLCNRFILREAIDLRSLYHCVLATKFGSETTYVQAVGRVLRNHPSLPGHVRITDHGANFWFHGSPNMARDWSLEDKDDHREYIRQERLREELIAEPYRCPKCSCITRRKGPCPNCGYEIAQRTRCVVQLDGQLRLQNGNMFYARPRAQSTAVDLWKRTYWSHYKKHKTFRQAFASFSYKHFRDYGAYAYPHSDWPFMPTSVNSHVRRVCDVSLGDLH